MFGGTFGTLRFKKMSFLNVILRFTPYWENKPTNAIQADSQGVYTSGKFFISSTINNFHLKCDVIAGSVVKRIREPVLFSFILIKPIGYKVIGEPETIQYERRKYIFSENYNSLFRR